MGNSTFKAEKLLRELIALPSVNPAFLPEGDPRAGEKRVSDFLATIAARAGLEIDFQPVYRGRSNLLARLTPSGAVRNRVMLAPHLDTVNATENQFVPKRRNGRLFGRGACDTKGAAAAMLRALCAVAAGGQRPRETEIVFAGLVDEENAQGGSRALARSGLKADLAIVGEPTRLEVVTAHKGSLWLHLKTIGRSAHGSRPDLGENAVRAMATVVDFLETRYRTFLKQRRHAVLGHATVNVGVICGGTQPNIVPDQCSIEVDRRTLPGEDYETVRRELAPLLRKAGLQAGIGNVKVFDCPPLETDPRLPFVQMLLRSAGRRKPAGADYFCDAAILARGGIPSVVFGPGDIAQAHTADEWISLESLERGALVLERFLRSLP